MNDDAATVNRHRGEVLNLRALDPAARVVVVTAVEQDEIDRRLSDKGVSAILRKPFSFEDFKTLMKTLNGTESR